MKSFTKGQLKTGINALRSAKLRSFWTMLGVIIGVTSVISVVAIGQGIKNQIGGQLHHYGKDLIMVRPAQLHTTMDSGNDGINLLSGLNVTAPLNGRDLKAIQTTKGVVASAPLTLANGTVRAPNGIYRNGLVLGTTADLPSLINQSLAYGAFLDDEDAEIRAAVLGKGAVDEMFDESVPLGRTFTIHGQEFIVRGIFNQFTTTPLSQQADFNKAIFISQHLAKELSRDTAPTYTIMARAGDEAQTNEVAASIERNLSRVHGGHDNFEVLTGSQTLAASNTILNLLTRLIAGVAAISLLVGGIGIMNVMLVSVAERMHEIGIRKAVGATNRQILSQFLLESSILTLVGGTIGIILSFVIMITLRLTTNLQPVIGWQIVVIATVVSLLVGIIFGTVPAIKAARKDPIEALRASE